MKKIKFLAVLLLVTLTLSACTSKIEEGIITQDIIANSTTQNDITNTEYMLITENEKVAFWFNKDTTAFKLVDKANGFEWYSAGKEQSLSEESAPFKISYVNESGLIETMDAMTNCISNGQYEFLRTDNGLSVTYSLGEYETFLMVPLAITKERMEDITGSIDDDFAKSQFETMYQYTEIGRLNEENKKLFLESYPKLSEQPLYILRDGISESADKMKKIADILLSTGYTEEMYNSDKEYFKSDETNEKEVLPQFRVQLVYSLDEDGFKVTVPQKEIQMNAEFPILEIELLKNFGSPNYGDNGYFLLPDGSGSLMNFYNGKGDLQNYSINIYGMDYSAYENENIYNTNQAYLPVYGIKNSENAIFAVIESGDAVATLNAYPGNEKLSAYVAPTFRLRSYHKLYMNGSKSASNYYVTYQNKRCESDIVVRYSLLNGENANYSAMAKSYREYLFKDSNKKTDNKSGAVIECIGQIDKTVKKFGTDCTETIPTTEFSQVKSIAEELSQKGISNLSIKLSGWFGGSYHNRYAAKMKINKNLGSRNELIELNRYLRENDIELYPDADMQYTYNTSAFDGFSKIADVARSVSKEKGYKVNFNPATFCRDTEFKTPAYINNPLAINNAFSGFFSKYKDLGIGNISLRNIGTNLDGDYSEENSTDRQKAADLLLEQVTKVKKDYKVMTNGANAYMLNQIDYCCNIPLTYNGYDNTDKSVPFLQMVLSGKIDYSGPVMNLGGDMKNMLLNMAAVAADPYCIITAQNANEVRNSNYSFLYSTDYSYLKDEICELLPQYIEDMSMVSGRQITDYIELTHKVYKTVFDGGVTVTVNYGSNDAEVGGIVYKAKSYTVEKGGA